MVSLPTFGLYDLLVFVLIFSLVYAVLSRSKFFDKSDIPALIAVAVGLISLASTFFVTFIIAFLPYVLAIAVFVFLIILILNTAMVPQEGITSYLKKSTLVPALVIFMMFIFGLIAYGYASSQSHSGTLSPSTVCVGCTTSSSSGGSSSSGSSSSGGGSSSSGSSSSGGTPVNQNFNYITSQYIISILTAPQVLSLILTLMAMAVAVFFITRERS